MKVLLVANYEGDRQESMNRFAQLLAAGLEASGIQVSVLRPPVRIGGGGLFSKWRAYVDKFILFRSMIRRASAAADLVHICDHSNAMYVELLRKPTVVTCHDLLAVRGALGENTDCP
ncbi:MAG TPA: glycosyltransferase, partial [Planctomycetota bacterium]|nr:glycosyltransferase [Planctomycetota bacterium]